MKGNKVTTKIEGLVPVVAGYNQVTVTDAAQTLAQLGATLDDNTAYVLCRLEGDDLRERVDGTAPTAAVGLPRYGIDAPWVWTLAEARKVQLIAVSGTPVLNIQEYR